MTVDLPRLEALRVERGTRALVRVDFNVPFTEDGQIDDDTRIATAVRRSNGCATGMPS